MQIDILKMIENERKLMTELVWSYKGGAKLVIIQVGDDQASNLYVKSKQKELPKWNIETELVKLTEDVTTDNIIELINHLNNEKDVNGIIVQLPLPEHINEQKVIDFISWQKNVDGFDQTYPTTQFFSPCTPKGIMRIIEHQYGLEDKVVTLIGRGKTVGEPLIKMLSKEPCTLICCNSHTSKKQLTNALEMSDIVISAVGQPNLFSRQDLKPFTLVIDTGISRVDGKQVGDFSHEHLDEYVDYTPWTNGVGKMTVAMLAENVIEAYRLQGGK